MTNSRSAVGLSNAEYGEKSTVVRMAHEDSACCSLFMSLLSIFPDLYDNIEALQLSSFTGRFVEANDGKALIQAFCQCDDGCNDRNPDG